MNLFQLPAKKVQEILHISFVVSINMPNYTKNPFENYQFLLLLGMIFRQEYLYLIFQMQWLDYNIILRHQGKYLIKLIVIATRNNAINMYNEIKRRNKSVVSTTMYDDETDNWEIMDIPDDTNDVQRLVINEETCRMLHDLINKLDLIYRDVVVLMQMGYSYEAIADILGITVETARKRYSRAKAKLREMGGKDLYV